MSSSSIEKKSAFLHAKMEGEITSRALMAAVFEVLARDDYHCTNLIFEFETECFTLSYGDLVGLTAEIRRRYPKKSTREKTAVVVSTGLSGALARMWADMVKNLPHEVRVFPSYPEAEAWMLSPRPVG